MKTTTLFLLTIILAFLNSVKASPFLKKKYEVSLKGTDESIEYLKFRADYKILRSTKYCRGAFLPIGSGDWWCSEESKGKQVCKKSFRCKRVSKSRSRKSESRRIKAEMKEVKYRSSGRHKIWVSQGPSKRKKRYRKYRPSKGPEDFSEVQYIGSGPIRGRVVKKKQKKMTETMKLAQAEEIKAKANKKSRQYEALEEMEKLYQQGKDQTEIEREQALLGGPNWEFLMEKSTDDDTLYYTVVQKDKDDKNEEPLLKLLNFAGGLVKITDSNNSVATVNLSWTPSLKFGKTSKWGIRANIGAHQYQLSETATTPSESFLIIDTELLLYRMMGRAYIEIGGGSQSWGGSIGESFQTLTGTLGYKFKRYQISYMERLFLSFTNIAATESATALKLGVGFSF